MEIWTYMIYINDVQLFVTFQRKNTKTQFWSDVTKISWTQKPCHIRWYEWDLLVGVLGNANTVVSDNNFSRRTTKIPYIGFHRTTTFSRACVPNQLVSLIVLSGDSLRRIYKANISIHAQSLKLGTIEQVGMAFL